MNESPPPQTPEAANVVIERLRIDYSVYYAVQEPEGGDETPPLLIAAHGRGQSCEGFIKNFASLRDKNILVVAPQGPNQLHGRHRSSKVGFSWTTRPMRENAIADLMAYLTRLTEVLTQKLTFDHERIFILGFSQGAGVAFRFAVNGSVRLAGVVACGGHVPNDVAEKLSGIEKFPVLIVHGESDPVVTVDRAREGEQILRDHGFEVETRYFDGGHGVPPEQVDAIAVWIASR